MFVQPLPDVAALLGVPQLVQIGHLGYAQPGGRCLQALREFKIALYMLGIEHVTGWRIDGYPTARAAESVDALKEQILCPCR